MSFIRKAVQSQFFRKAAADAPKFFRKLGDNSRQFSTETQILGHILNKGGDRLKKFNLGLSSLNEAKDIAGDALKIAGAGSNVVGKVALGTSQLATGKIGDAVRTYASSAREAKQVAGAGKEILKKGTSLGGKVALAIATKNPLPLV